MDETAHWKANHDRQVELKRRAKERLNEALAALDDLATSIACADFDRAMAVGFIWSQRREYILGGEETWADQKLRPVQFGTAVEQESEQPHKVFVYQKDGAPHIEMVTDEREPRRWTLQLLPAEAVDLAKLLLHAAGRNLTRGARPVTDLRLAPPDATEPERS